MDCVVEGTLWVQIVINVFTKRQSLQAKNSKVNVQNVTYKYLNKHFAFYKDGLDLWPVPYISLWDGPAKPESNQLDGRTEGSRTVLSLDVADPCEWDSTRMRRSVCRARCVRGYVNIRNYRQFIYDNRGLASPLR
jgi:hypothetical protein